jgi:hypothetical protein
LGIIGIANMPKPPATAEEYRQEAARIRKHAATIKDEANRQQALSIADSYDRLAEAVAILDRQRGGSN